MDDRQKEILKKSLSKEEIQNRYQQAINYFANGATDKSEYKTYQEMQLKRDMNAACHAWLSMVITWEEYFDLIQALVGFDLMIQGVISGQIKAKHNGEDTDKEADADNLMTLSKDE